MKIKILGTGCSSCVRLENNVTQVLKENEINADVEKVTDISEIMSYGVMSVPALVIDEKVISYGRVLSHEEIKKILEEHK